MTRMENDEDSRPWMSRRSSMRCLGQRPVSAEHYDDEYFQDDWREGDNRYDLETRRRIEARNPALIKEVFQPKRVLDVGCGPGFLMYFLHELGVEADGVDFSRVRELAPPEVRDRISDRRSDRRRTCRTRATTS